MRTREVAAYAVWCGVAFYLTGQVGESMLRRSCYEAGNCYPDPVATTLFIGFVIWLIGTFALVKFWNR